MNLIIETYVLLIKRGKLTLAEVPNELREEVEKELEKVA
jgi:hypothetical protein